MHGVLRKSPESTRSPGPALSPASHRLSVAMEREPAAAPAFSGLIVAIAQRRDRDAFAALFRHFAPRVKSYLMRLGTSAEAAEELAQEALLTVWRRAEAYDPAKAAASTWIFTIARNLRIDRARRDGRPPPLEDPSDHVGEPPPADDRLIAAQDGVRVGRALEGLPPDQMQVVRLAFFSGKAHAQIAAELSLPLGTVKSRLRLAMTRLRVALDDRT